MKASVPRVAMVLAAGRGRRMQPLSDVLPKPALSMPGGPVVSWGLRLVAQTGIQSAVVNTWWMPEVMEQSAAASAPAEVDLHFSREEQLMETAGGLALARDRGLLGKEGPVLVINGDGILDLNLEDFFCRHQESDDLVTLGLLPHPDPEQWSRVLLGRDGHVSAILPSGLPAPGETPLLYPGVMLVAREALETLQVTPSGVASTLWNPAKAQGRLGGTVVSGHWREVGTPADYLETTCALLGEQNEISQNCRVADNATLNRTLVGPDVDIGQNAVVGQSIISHGAIIGAGAKIHRSIVLGKVTVRAGEIVTNEIRTPQSFHSDK